MIKKLTLTFALIVSLTSWAADAPKAKDWEKMSDEDGIITWKKDIPGSDVVAFRGHTAIEAPIAKVANVLIDTSRKKEWVANIAEAKDVRTISSDERIEYNHTYSGFFLVKDRDFVFDAKVLLDRPKRTMTVLLKSVADPAMPEKGPVRGEIKHGSYILTSSADGKKTDVTVEIQADPKGTIPMWLVNMFQKNWPRKTLEGIRNQAAKADVVEHAGVKAYFAEGVAQALPTTTKPASAPVSGIKKISDKK